MQRRPTAAASRGTVHRPSVTTTVVEPLEARRLLSGYTLDQTIREVPSAAGGLFGDSFAAGGNLIVEVDGAKAVAYDATSGAGTPLVLPAGYVWGNQAAVLADGKIAVGGQVQSGSAQVVLVYDGPGDTSATVIAAPVTDATPATFVSSLGALGDDLLVGNRQGGPAVGASNHGVVYRYDLSGPAPALVQAYTGPANVDGVSNLLGTGGRLFAAGNRILASAIIDTPVGPGTQARQGVVELDATTGAVVRTFTDPAPSATVDGFGINFVITANGSVVVSAFARGGNGAVYQYDPAGALVATYANPEPVDLNEFFFADQQFGLGLAVAGDTVFVGAPGQLTLVDHDNSGTPNLGDDHFTGAVFALDVATAAVTKIANPDLEIGNGEFTIDRFGQGLAVLADGRLVVSDPSDDNDPAGGLDNGAIHVFAPDAPPPTNTPPTVGPIVGLTTGVRQQTLTFAGSFTDPDVADTHAATWELRDAANTLLATDADLSFSYTFVTAGAYTLTLTVSDGQASDGEAVAITIGETAQLPDGTVLVGAAATGVNAANITGAGSSVSVWLNGATASYTAATGVVVYGGGGTDIVNVAGNVTLPVTIFAGDGIDLLKGGAGADVIVGGDGADLIVGGGGRDLLIGGRGSDRIVGNTDDDVIVSGHTDYDADVAALAAVLAEWTSTNTYVQRVNNIRTGGGLTAGYALENDGPAATVFDDGAVDILTGSQGSDFFLANLEAPARDRITDLSASEFADDIDFINS